MKKYFFYADITNNKVGIFPNLETLSTSDMEDREMFGRFLGIMTQNYKVFQNSEFRKYDLGYVEVPREWIDMIREMGQRGMSISEQRIQLNRWVSDPGLFDRISVMG